MDSVRARLLDQCSAQGRRVVVSAVPQAASAGIGAFAQGGNAFDAVLAACFVEGVALPMKCGLAGDLVALFRVEGGPVRALLSVGAGAASLARGHRLEPVGAKSVGVPGAPDGYAALQRMGRLGLPRLVAPAVAAARDGVRWTGVGLGYLAEARELLQRWSPGCVYLQEPVPSIGSELRLPGLAALLEAFAASGSELFFGPEGTRLVEELGARGGFLDVDDLRTRPARVCEPASVQLRGGETLLAVPAPTDGQLLLEAIVRLQASQEDPAGVVAELRAAARRLGSVAEDGGTSVASAADDEGNFAVVVHSNSFPRFGSGVVLESGLVLNNRPGRGFDLDAPAGSRRAPTAGATPPTTLHAWALQDGAGLTVGATPGGVNQLPWNVQTVRDLLAGMSPAEAVTAPRWAIDDQGSYSAEPGAAIHVEQRQPRPVGAFGFRSVQQVMRIGADGFVLAAADPRAGARASALY